MKIFVSAIPKRPVELVKQDSTAERVQFISIKLFIFIQHLRTGGNVRGCFATFISPVI